jgi:hypothetical protein
MTRRALAAGGTQASKSAALASPLAGAASRSSPHASATARDR